MQKTIGSVLIVDESIVIRDVLKRNLKENFAGVHVATAENGKKALKELASGQFDMLISALHLSDIDGIKLCKGARKIEKYHSLQTIIVSSDADTRLIKDGFNSGVNHFYDKHRGDEGMVEFIHNVILRAEAQSGNVLLVEDSMTAGASIKRVLASAGITVTHVTSVEAAIEELGTKDTCQYDMIISDHNLDTDLSGGDLVILVRNKLGFSQEELPILVLTGSGNEGGLNTFINAGANDFLSKGVMPEVLLARVSSALCYRNMYANLRVAATTDALTSARNKQHFLTVGERMVKESSRWPISLMVFDIDHFKKINDTHGHIVGDHVLRELGHFLTNNIDPKDGMVVRYGGEEFVVMLYNKPQSRTRKQAEWIRKQVEELTPAGIPITTSIGISSTSVFKGANLVSLFKAADEALYAAKNNGRNAVFFATEEGPKPDRAKKKAEKTKQPNADNKAADKRKSA